jgi:hypothetical protein
MLARYIALALAPLIVSAQICPTQPLQNPQAEPQGKANQLPASQSDAQFQQETDALPDGVIRAEEKRDAGHPTPPPDNSAWWFNLLLTVFTGGSVVVGLIQSNLLFGTLKATEKAANAARDAARASPRIERAYVFLDGDGMRCKTEGGEMLININLAFRNFGKTPATIGGINGRYFYSLNRYIDRLSAKDGEVPPGIIIGPSKPWAAPAKLNATIQEIQEAEDGSGYLYLCVELLYVDIFGESHITGFCWEANVETGGFTLSPNNELNYHT